MTTASQAPDPGRLHPVLGCVGRIASALDDVAGIDAAYLTGAEKRAALLGLSGVLSGLEELRLRVLAAGQELGDVAVDDASRDAAAWLAHHAHLDPSRARRLARLAGDLAHRYPTLGAALRAGRVDLAQADVIARALTELPDDLDPDLLALAEKELIANAADFDPRGLRILGRRILGHIAPDIADEHEARALADEENLAEKATFLRSRRRGDGTTDIHARLADNVAERLMRYLHAYTSPRHGTPDRPTTDAATTDPATTNAATPAAESAPATSAGDTPGPAAGPVPATAAAPDPDDPTPPTDAATTAPPAARTSDRRPYHHKLGHALGALLEHLDPRRLPLHGGDATTVIVTIDHHTLLTELDKAGVALAGDQPITAAHARRLACTANVIPAVLSGDSEILDLGRSRRLFSRAQRKALAVTFPRCAANGCDIPAPWCEAHHHTTTWASGGTTNLTDGVLLCSHHHRRAHDPRFVTTRHPDGSIRFHRRT